MDDDQFAEDSRFWASSLVQLMRMQASVEDVARLLKTSHDIIASSQELLARFERFAAPPKCAALSAKPPALPSTPD
ncbi:MAG TPA: hypothetical protein VFB32_07445 [Rudaea sp.]|nr:hypothetical protein [Rudaea sp.]